MTDGTRDALRSGLEQLGLISSEQILWNYYQLLKRWNRTYNLVAKAPDQTLLSRHIFDSLSVRHLIPQGRCLDVGSGAGLPGLLLAATMPDAQWVLLDANGKKVRFCEQAVHELGLKNVRVVQQRIEAHCPQHSYDTIISRAYAQADSFVLQVQHLLSDDGQILAMKGRVDKEERSRAAALGLHINIETLIVPELTGQRHVMIFAK